MRFWRGRPISAGWLLWGLLGLFLALAPTKPASAHAVLELAVPADRSVLQVPPRQFSLRFDEAVVVTDLRLLDGSGRAVKIMVTPTDGAIDGMIDEDLAAGTYTIGYRIISADGHPVAGAVQFQIGTGPAHWAAHETGFVWWQWGKLAARWILYLGAFLAWGTISRGVRRGVMNRHVLAVSSVAAIAADIAAIGLQGIAISGGGPADLLWPALWWNATATQDGKVLLLTAIGIALAWCAWYLRRNGLVARILRGASAVALIAIFATTGHVSAIGNFAAAVLAVHAACALLWIGSLGAMLRRPQQSVVSGIDTAGEIAASSSGRTRRRQAMYAILIAAGIGISCWQIVAPSMLFTTTYGLVLAFKFLLVMLVLALAAVNRWGRVPSSAGRRRMFALGQAGLLVIVLGLTAALGQLTPPRHILAARAGAAALQASGHAGHGDALLDVMLTQSNALAEINITSDGDGGYDMAVWIDDVYERRLNPQQVTVNLTNLDAGIGPLTRELTANPDDGSYVVHDLRLSPVGRWRVEVKADVSDFDRRIFQTEVTVTE